jgi:predicted enzyme related to lactoylglutathione lyase
MRTRFIIPVFAALAVAAAGGVVDAPASAAAAIENGRFVWHDLMTRDVQAVRRFYGDLLGWQFEDVKRGDRAYVLARVGSDPVAGIVDISHYPEAGAQWLSFMSVDDVDAAVGVVQSAGGTVLLDARELEPVARVAVVADPQGAPLGLAKLRKDPPEMTKPVARQFFWDEYLASDAAQALDFYKRLAGYRSSISDTRLGVEYHVLENSRKRAGLFQLPASAAGILPNWLPYILVDDPAAMAPRVAGLGGRVILPAAPERRNGTLVIIKDPSGAPLALQKYPY